VLGAAKDYPEGRWLFIPVRSRKSAQELRSLIALKMSRPRNIRTGGRAADSPEDVKNDLSAGRLA
jgi:hypothetical protein